MVAVPDALLDFTERLDLTGTGVEGVQSSGSVFDRVVVGQILTRERHPDSDHLWLTTVDVGSQSLDQQGQQQPLQIVCGAQNFVAGDKVPVAMVGAVLPGGLRIKKAKMRGVVSEGMNCSARELELADDHDGIMILSADAPIGMPIAEYLGLSDTLIDLEITPNRPDCMSMFGLAREVAAIYDRPYCLPGVEDLMSGAEAGEKATFAAAADTGCSGCAMPAATATATATGGSSATGALQVQIADAERCSRYTARLLRGVKVGPSPAWLAERVSAAGARSINNVVDITNYIMFEVGQPLHAFDYDRLAKDSQGQAAIIVRGAEAGERFTTLDGETRTLDSDVTCIVDGNADAGRGRTIALAGVMGGLDTEVTESTVNILLESASFSAAHTSRTSRKLQLFSEASARFERGVDDVTCDDFCLRAAQLMAAVAGGQVEDGVADDYPLPSLPPTLCFRVGRCQRLIGAPIAAEAAAAILRRLGAEVGELVADASDVAADGGVQNAGSGRAVASSDYPCFSVTPPSYRPDLTREIDLYEEVLRIWGMDRVQATLPGGRGRIGTLSAEQARMRTLGQTLRAAGLNETMTYVFAADSDPEAFPMAYGQHEEAAELINPMSFEQRCLRRSILPGLLRSVAYNLSHGVADIQLYEVGAVFLGSAGRKLPKERSMLAAVMTGALNPDDWSQKPRPLDFYDAKGVIESLAHELHVQKLRFKALATEDAPWLQAGRAAQVMAGSSVLGWLGDIDPRVLGRFQVNVPLVAFELGLSALLKAAGVGHPYQDVPLYPAVERDLAVVVDAAISAEQLLQHISSAGGKLLDSVRIFDVFEDTKKLGANKKSLAFALQYRAADRTLTSEEADAIHQKIIAKLSANSGAEIRS